jgi:hypothetical protein
MESRRTDRDMHIFVRIQLRLAQIKSLDISAPAVSVFP